MMKMRYGYQQESYMSSIRIWHTYIGLLIAPSVLFFCLTGALQLFGLHEAHAEYHPAMIIEKLGMVHKDQVFAPSERHEGPQAEGAAHPEGRPAEEDEGRPAAGRLLLKCFFLLVAIGLATSTSLGLWMGLTYVRHKRTGLVLLALGVLVPVALLLL
jgi:hypothetical protein